MRVLVTGGAGFIGSHITDQLVARGHELIVLDALLPAAHDGEPEYATSGARRVWNEVNDLDALASLVVGIDAVCHQAAMVGLGVDFADAPAYVRHNDAGTAALLSALHHARFGGRLVLASSMVVYGEGGYRCGRHGTVRPGPRLEADLADGRWEPPCPACGAPLEPAAVIEDAALDPRNVYAATKVHQEHLTACFAREHPEVAVVALRYHNVYGPRMPFDTPYAGVAAIFRSALEAGRAPAVFEDGGQLRDFVHVDDVARANVLAVEGAGPQRGFAAYNVASGDPHTVGEMAVALAAACRGPAPEVVGRYRLGDVRHVVGSPTRAAAELGFRARIPFAEGIRQFASAPSRRRRCPTVQ